MNGHRFLIATVALLALVQGPSATAAPAFLVDQQIARPTPSDRDLGAAFDAYMQAAVQNAAFSGVVLVAKDGRPIYRKSFGLANRAFNVPITVETRFQLASITKPFTSVLIMMLHEEGKLNVDDLACDYLPDCPPAWRLITIQQLLTHTSGLPNYSSLPDWDETLDSRTYGKGGLVALVRDLPLEFAPGEGFRYSNTGYNLLGTIVERVSGKPLPDMMRDRILTPLGMSHTVFNSSRLVIPDQATGYYSIGSTFIESSPQSMTGVYGEAGLSSTVDDLLAWARALDAHTLISSATSRQMTDDARNNYGFGWELRTWSNRRMIGHAGSGPGFSNMVSRFPDDGLTVIVLSNSDEASGGGTARALAGIFFGETPSLPTIQPKTLILDAILKDGVGAGIRRYQELKSGQPSAEAFLSDDLLVEVGYELFGLPSMEAARRVFEFALETFPQSAYSHDGLADIAAAEGDVTAAISQFEASLRIDPENQYAVDGLQRLRSRPAR